MMLDAGITDNYRKRKLPVNREWRTGNRSRREHTTTLGREAANMAAADAHIAGLINDVDPGAFVTKYVVVAEVIDANGERGVWMAANEDATQWDTYGLLTYALNHEAAHAEYDED